MLEDLCERVTSLRLRLELRANQPPPTPEPVRFMQMSHPAPEGMAPDASQPLDAPPGPSRAQSVDPADPSTWSDTPRNTPCPCGIGKRQKHCHGRS